MEDPGSQTIYIQLLVLLLLTLLNAFFSASEMALVSLNRSRVEQKAAEGRRSTFAWFPSWKIQITSYRPYKSGSPSSPFFRVQVWLVI